MGTTAYDPSSGVVSLPAYPTALKNPNSMTIKAGTATVSSYDGSAAKTFTVAASTTAGAFTISDGTTTRTIQLAGKFTDADTHYTNYLQIKGNGAEAVKFTQDSNKTLNLKPSGSVSISAASGEITISATDTHNSHIVYSGKKSDGTTDISSGTASSGNITLGDSGVTAGAYGDTAAQTPGYGSTFKVPSISVNAKGIVTAVGEHTVKIPDNSNLVPYTGASKDVNLGKHSLFMSNKTGNTGNPTIKLSAKGLSEDDCYCEVSPTSIFIQDPGSTITYGDNYIDSNGIKIYLPGNNYIPDGSETFVLKSDLSTLLDKGTSSTVVNQVVYNPVEMKKALKVPSIRGENSGNNYMNGAPLYSLGSTMATENGQATGSSILELAGYTGATGNPRDTIIAQRASGDFEILPASRRTKGLCFSDSSDKWTIAGSPILTESSISTQQWTLTSTTGTTTTVNICVK